MEEEINKVILSNGFTLETPREQLEKSFVNSSGIRIELIKEDFGFMVNVLGKNLISGYYHFRKEHIKYLVEKIKFLNNTSPMLGNGWMKII